MIVAVVLDYNFLCQDKTDGLWVFYKYLDFCKKNNLPIIGRDLYFNNPKKYKNHWALDSKIMDYYDYGYPDKDTLNINKNYMIPDKIVENLNIDWYYLLNNDCLELKNAILNSLKKIEKNSGKKIKTILTWYPFKTLKNICEKKQIKLVNMELTSIRGEWYNYTLGTLSLFSKYDASMEYGQICNFNLNNNLPLLSREELILLFSKKCDVKENLFFLKRQPSYEVGYVMGLNNDPYELTCNCISQEEVIENLKKSYFSTSILVRPHPQEPSQHFLNEISLDDSKSCREFISKCDKIVINVSNVGYESMLYAKKVTHLNTDFISSFGVVNELSCLNEAVIDLNHLNFITFYLYCPFEKMFDIGYINDRISNKNSVDELYMINLKKVLSDHYIDCDIFFKLTKKDRIKMILEKNFNFNVNEIENILTVQYSGFGNSLENKLKIMSDEYLLLNDRYMKKDIELKELEHKYLKCYDEKKCMEDINFNLTNSTSWKITRPLRSISRIIKKFLKKG